MYGRLREDAQGEKKRLAGDEIFVVTWDKLLEDAERLHREYLEIVKARAPEDDPRIRGLGLDANDAASTE